MEFNEKNKKMLLDKISSAFGMVFLISSLVYFFQEKASYAVFFLIFSLIFFPNVSRFIERKTHFHYALWIRILILLLGIIVVFIAFSKGSANFDIAYNGITTLTPMGP